MSGVLPGVLYLVLAVGAGVLWAKTKRAAVLLQLIGSSLIFLLFALHQLSVYTDKRALVDAVQSLSVPPVFFITFLLFTIGYVWYALSEKGI